MGIFQERGKFILLVIYIGGRNGNSLSFCLFVAEMKQVFLNYWGDLIHFFDTHVFVFTMEYFSPIQFRMGKLLFFECVRF